MPAFDFAIFTLVAAGLLGAPAIWLGAALWLALRRRRVETSSRAQMAIFGGLMAALVAGCALIAWAWTILHPTRPAGWVDAYLVVLAAGLVLLGADIAIHQWRRRMRRRARA